MPMTDTPMSGAPTPASRPPSQPQPLDPLTLPLRGSRLIEASAGTGKTWTIAAVYLRLVLGHGGPGLAAARPLQPAEILVMTFTRAATRELSDRIRARLVQAAACFRGGPPGDDPLLVGLLADHPEGPVRSQAAWRLAMAAEAMDDAAIFTIDAWCQRMLREHAFDSGSLFDETLLPNATALLAEAVRDYWRQQVYPLDDVAMAAVLALWPTLERLQGDVDALLKFHDHLPAAAGQGSLAEVIDNAQLQRQQALTDLKAGWPERVAHMREWLDAQFAGKQGPLDKVKLKPSTVTGWLDKLDSWAADPQAAVLDIGKGAERLTPDGLRGCVKPGHTITPPEAFHHLGPLLADLATLPGVNDALRAHATASVHQRLQLLKTQQRTPGFDDLLQRLHDALDARHNGAGAQRLRQRILQQYPAALVDEFQDTSPVQLGIFNALYRIADNAQDQVLLLIGDPKQSIYGFRGADIHSYLGARRATRGRHHVLGTNHRSTQALVNVVNQLFGAAEQRAGEGAFLFRSAAAGGSADLGPAGGRADLSGPENASNNPLPFQPVAARGRKQQLMASGAELPGLTVCAVTQTASAIPSRRQMAALCTEHIVMLLNDAPAGFFEHGQRQQPLRPADIAVLVRTGVEAEAVRQALRQRGVASVYLSDRDTVFDSAEAADLLRLLQAVAAPRDGRLARAALATGLLGRSLDELQALAQDDALFDAQSALLGQLQAVWQGQGVLAMLHRALHGFGLPARWLAGQPPPPDGERRLTNLLHLAELLQAASAELDGEPALLRWLATQIELSQAGEHTSGDEPVLRLESDADLVQVITVHKSKGLEYPVVLLPFASHVRVVAKQYTRQVLLPADETGVADGSEADDGLGGGPDDGLAVGEGLTPMDRHLVLSPNQAQLAQADHDRLREDLRLLYVALTRARHALWVGASAVNSKGPLLWTCSALGYLVSGPGTCTADQMARDLAAWADTTPGVALVTLPAADAAPSDAAGGPAVLVGSRQAGPSERTEPAALTDEAAAVAAVPAVARQADSASTKRTGKRPPGPALPMPPVTRLQRRTAPTPLAETPVYDGQFDRQWAIASFSALVRDAGRGSAAGLPPAAGPGTATGPVAHGMGDGTADAMADEPADLANALATGATPQTLPDLLPSLLRADDDPPAAAPSAATLEPRPWRSDDEPGTASATPPATRRLGPQPWHRFPRGALPGNLLHELLEGLADDGFSLDGSPSQQQALTARIQRLGWGHRADDLLAWLRRVCSTPLPAPGGPGVALSALQQRLPEMEFWYPSDGLNSRALDQLCRQHLLPGQDRPALSDRALHGLMMGFADLVFAHDGRYWVLDYKSNALGEQDSDYTATTMANAVLDNRYDLQAALYGLALHRLLRARLGTAYQPGQHLGGALFFFLRGINGPANGVCHLAAPPALLDALDALLAGASADLDPAR